MAAQAAIVEEQDKPKVAKNPNYPNLNAGGTPGHEGSGGRPPNKLREVCRDTFGLIVDELAPGCLKLAKAISALANEDCNGHAEAQATLKRFRDVGWNPEQVVKVANSFRDAGLPKQSQIILANQDALKLATECYAQGQAEGWDCEQYTNALAQLMGIEE